jgi:peptide/nickel transport system ATP-binding protein
MGHQAACYMAIPGSGHSRAPAKENTKESIKENINGASAA